jgi:HlyD family secretion protein
MGQTVAASFQTPTLFLIATDLTKMQVDTNVSESDIGGITDGDKSIFTVDAFPKRTFEGTVVQVRQSPQTVQNVVTYDVVVGIDNADLALKPGMTAANRIITDQRTDVLRVPSQALRYAPVTAGATRRTGTAGRTRPAEQGRVWVLRDGKAVRVAVTTGLDDDTYTEIVKGELKADDQVIIAEQRTNSSKTAPPRLP